MQPVMLDLGPEAPPLTCPPTAFKVPRVYVSTLGTRQQCHPYLRASATCLPVTQHSLASCLIVQTGGQSSLCHGAAEVKPWFPDSPLPVPGQAWWEMTVDSCRALTVPLGKGRPVWASDKGQARARWPAYLEPPRVQRTGPQASGGCTTSATLQAFASVG